MRDDTLGALAEIDPQAAGCAVVVGRLEPVLRIFAGPGRSCPDNRPRAKCSLAGRP